MNTVVVVFYSVLSVYLVVVGIIALVKFIQAKKKAKEDLKTYEQNKEITSDSQD